MHSNHHTLTHQQHHNTTRTTTQRLQGHYNKTLRLTCIPPSIHLLTSSRADPFANMNAYVDYQQKIESLKASLVSNTTKPEEASASMTNKNDDDTARITRPLTFSKRHHHRRQSSMIDVTGDDDGRFWSNGSVMSSGSSSGDSSSGCLTPPRSLSPMTTTTTTYFDHHEQQTPSESDTGYVTMKDKLKFLAFLRHRTGWHTTTDTTTDLDYMKNSGSLFFWYGQ